MSNAAREDTSPTRFARPRESWSTVASNYGVFVFLIILIIGFTIGLPGRFATGGNVRALLADNAVPGILALSVMLPLAAGEFDLSVAANLGFCSVVSAELASHGMDLFPILAIVILIGAMIGAFNALLIVGVGVNAFIATLGVSTVLAGGNLWVSNSENVFSGIGPSVTDFATTTLFDVQIVFFYFLVLAVVLWYVLERTPYGRYLRATGMGRDAARLSGVRTSRYLTSAFVVAGLLAGFAGLVQTARFASAPPTIGPEFLLPAYAAAFLGATTIRRGMFNVWGTVVGVFILAVGINGLTLAGAPVWFSSVFNGTALIVAVSASVLLARQREK